jgi:hypothetical protein
MLRFMRRRVPAIIAGVVLIAAAGWIETSPRVNVWWLEGLALVAGATGVAILWTGLAGVTPDWREPDENR